MLRNLTLSLPAWLALALASIATAVAFHASATSVGRALGAAEPAALAALAPVALATALVIAISRAGAPAAPKLEPAMLGAVPMLLVAVLLAPFGPARLGFQFWFLRLDLAALSAFLVGAVMLAVGVRASVGRNGAGWAVFATLPPLVLAVLNALERGLGALTRSAAERISDAVPLGVSSLGDGDFLAQGNARLSVASACAGVEGVAAVALVAIPLLLGTDGLRRRKLELVAGALAAAWLANLARVIALLALAGHGHNRAFELVHSYGGVAVIAAVVAASLVAAPLLGLRWKLGSLTTRVAYTGRHVVSSACLLLAAGSVIAWSQASMAGVGLRAAIVDGKVPLQYAYDGRGKQVPDLAVGGWMVRHDDEYRWFRQYFGGASDASSYTLLRGGEQPVWAQVIIAGSRRDLDRFGPVDCFIAHGAAIYRVERIALAGGSGMLVEQRQRSVRFSALSFVQAVIRPDGSPGYRRVTLFALARRGSDHGAPKPGTRFERVAYGIMNVFSPVATRSSHGYAFGPPNRALVDVAHRIARA